MAITKKAVIQKT